MQGGCCLETGWASRCPWEVVNDFLGFACIFSLLPFTSWAACILTHEFSHFCSPCSLPHPTGGRAEQGEGLRGHSAASYGQPTSLAKYTPLKRDTRGVILISEAFSGYVNTGISHHAVSASLRRFMTSLSELLSSWMWLWHGCIQTSPTSKSHPVMEQKAVPLLEVPLKLKGQRAFTGPDWEGARQTFRSHTYLLLLSPRLRMHSFYHYYFYLQSKKSSSALKSSLVLLCNNRRIWAL